MSDDMWPEEQTEAAYARKAKVSDLDDKLQELTIYPINYYEDLRLSDEDIVKIKQAIDDAGYIPLRPAIDKYLTAGGDKNYYVIAQEYVDKHCMTGQEWYDRFKAELPDDVKESYHLDGYGLNTFTEAAKRAAGISND